MTPRRHDGIRLPPPTPLEDGGFPVTVYDAAGRAIGSASAAEWRAAHQAPRCPHGYRLCFACRYAAPGPRAPSRLVPPRSAVPRQSDAALIDAIAAHA